MKAAWVELACCTCTCVTAIICTASSRAIGHADATNTAADRESSAASAGGDSDHMTYVHPHPPAEPMTSQRRQRRVRSAGKQRTPADGHLTSNHPGASTA